MTQARPNVIIVMSDDHSAAAVSAYGSRLASIAPTPSIDRLAAEGAIFPTMFCTNAICTPSRATMLSGQHSHTNGVRTLSDPLPEDVLTYPEMLQDAGYQTALVGKWHLHARPRGFDHLEVLPGQGVYHDPRFLDSSSATDEFSAEAGDDVGVAHHGHVTDLITDKSLTWLAARDRDRPFLLLCHHKAPHDDFEYQDRFEHLLDEVTIPEVDSLWDDRRGRCLASRHYGSSVSERNPVRNAVERMSQPGYPTGRLDVRGLSHHDRTVAAYQKYLADYLRTVAGVDESVGKLLDFLDEDGVSENTIVIYTSDQGMLLGERDHIDKRWSFDESLGIPFLVRWPNQVPPGTVVDHVVSTADIAPTVLEAAGLSAPESMQGHSMVPLMTEQPTPTWSEATYFRYWMHLTHHDVPAHLGIRTDTHKLIFYYGLPLDATDAIDEPTAAGWELYDVVDDPEELHNLYDDPHYRDTVRGLTRQLVALRHQVGDTDEDYPEVIARWQQTCLAGASPADAGPDGPAGQGGR